MCKLLLFAGTTEGRLLYERLSARGIEMDISVATEYGKELVEPLGGRIYAGRHVGGGDGKCHPCRRL